MRRERSSILPAVVFSAAVHAVLLFLAWQYWPKTDQGGGTFGITPVTLVAQGPVGNTTAPVPETPEDMATPEPVPDEEPAVVAPPTPAPVPTPAPTKPSKPTPQVPTGNGSRAAPSDNSFLDQLSQSIRGGGGAKQSGGQRGPATPKQGTAVAATGGCLSANNPCPWKEGLGEKIERYWNPNCAVEGGDSVKLIAKVTFNADGFLVGEPEISDARSGRVFQVRNGEDANAGVSAAAAIRAYSAIRRILPYTGVPRELVGRRIVLNLNADKACG